MAEFAEKDAQLLRRLADRADITDVITRFAVGIDMKDWALLESCFAESVTFDFPPPIGLLTMSRDEMIMVPQRFFPRLDATQHISANHQIMLDGDKATCVSTLHAQHYLRSANGDPIQRQIGYYVYTLVRQEGWKIAVVKQQVSWCEGNWQVFLHAEEGLKQS